MAAFDPSTRALASARWMSLGFNQQLPRGKFQCTGDFFDIVEGDVAFAALHRTHVCAMDSDEVSEGLL